MPLFLYPITEPSRRNLLRHGLVVCCCLLAFLASTPAAVCLAVGSASFAHAASEPEKRTPIEEDEDTNRDEQTKEATRVHEQRHGRRATHRSANAAWQAHLPHHHVSTSGYELPRTSPFAHGVKLPLRC